MKYLSVFNIRLQHAYYSDGRSPDFTITPSPQTSQLLKNYRAMTRTLADGLAVITSVLDSGNAFVQFPDDLVLRFELRLQNPEFVLITDPRDIPTSPAPLYSNASLSAENEKELTLGSREAWAQESFEVATPIANETFVLSGKPLPGTTVGDITLSSEGGGINLVDFSAHEKRFTVDSQAANAGQTFTLRYPLAPSMPEGVFAHIDIHINDSLPNATQPVALAREFHISYRAKQATWAYYYLTDLNNADSAYRIVDTPPADQGPVLNFNDANRRNLNTDPDPLDNFASELAARYPLLNRFRFLSDAPIACRQQAHKHVTLQINGNKLAGALPNPSFRNFSTGRIKVGDTVQQQDWLYEVVKILTHNGA